MAHEIVINAAMFQGVSTEQKIWKRVGGDVTRFSELGCLACLSPGRFDTVLNEAKKKGIGGVKALGEKWVMESAIDTSDDTNTGHE